jgi:diguanylate cyclase (GGDEF)-like protein
LEQTGSFGDSPYRIEDLQLFHEADHGLLAALIAPCPVLRLVNGEQLADSGRARLYIVLAGALAVAADADHGPGDGAIQRILPGESVGEQSVLEDSANLATMVAVADTDLLAIDAELVWTLIERSGGFARNLLRLLSFRIRAANAQLRRGQRLGEFYRKMSMNDGLTGLYNRTWLSDMLPKMVATAQRAGTPLALVMIDLDHFKIFNDTHGHLTGDDALRAAAAVIGVALRPSDFAVRYGGEEMMVILPETNALLAVMVAERLCARMREASIFPDMRLPLPHVTASVGVAVLGEGMDDMALIAAADAALYRAKNGGRNQVAL